MSQQRMAVLKYVARVNKVIRAGHSERTIKQSAREMWSDVMAEFGLCRCNLCMGV